MRISSVAFGIGGGENSVDKNEGADNLGTEAVTLGVTRGYNVSAAAFRVVQSFSEAFHHAGAADRPQTLHHHVEHRPSQRQLPRQEQPECHRRIDMPPYRSDIHKTYKLTDDP